ncbi:Radical SAM domain protein [Spirochaeta thermophila DSM 6578]|uniref:Radical SAM domain protein n=1 Tax=Winmispira thermophila (strain ATCC 700085 / DSM 6578 / Z-1203) TaxID=869211 RepID=G0GCW6_WINT7|nr:spiro-SPASM protein [Spirochaeta thermophila]AEJ61258.1 Radical SAM domain protein [Spirochaeta thermophila DSM 6578]
MKYDVVLTGLQFTEYALKPLASGPSAFARALDLARRLSPRLHLLLPPSHPPLPDGAPTPLLAPPTQRGLAEALATLAAHTDAEAFLILHADAPFTHHGLATRLLDQHERYFADYTFAEGHPDGLAPEVVSRRALSALTRLAGDEPVTRKDLFPILQKDINAFDIETILSSHDARLLRIPLFADTRRTHLLCDRLAALPLWDKDADEITAYLLSHKELLRTLPAYYQVQIVRGCPQSCAYCPYPLKEDVRAVRAFMEPERFAGLVDRIAAFSDDAVIGLSLWGEPGLHPAIAELAAHVLAHPRLSLLLETSGIGWGPAALERTASLDTTGRLMWIVSLDAVEPSLYRTLRGDGLEEALRTVETLHRIVPAHTYVQAVRMKENDAHLRTFYQTLTDRGYKVIFQQYDSFCGRLPDRMVVDISPLTRIPCWHLARDMVILFDGTVPLCREDLDAAHALGNVWEDELEELWERGRPWYERHVREEYPELCARCTEYFNFNF